MIKVENLSKSFRTEEVETIALNGVSFEVKDGEFVAIMGPSGCGKSTLLNILGLLDNPTGGKYWLDGKEVDALKEKDRTDVRKGQIGFVFQSFNLIDELNVEENIELPLTYLNIPAKERKQKVQEIMKRMAISHRAKHFPHQLSGGQQQRVAIARAIVNEPEVLLLDEPLAALDLKMRKDMQMELKEMHRELGITFIYVTHDQEEALTLSDTIVVMNEGVIQQIGTPEDIYNEPANSFVADFIGESNILNGIIPSDNHVQFIYHDFECVDKGFAPDEHVDVVVRPEDIYIFSNNLDKAQFTGTVQSCIFKGVHNEMTVLTKEGYEVMVQDYNAFAPGTEVGMLIRPDDIHVMHKECLCNSFEAEYVSDHKLRFLDAEWEVAGNDEAIASLSHGEKVKIEVNFADVDLMDQQEDGNISGHISFILYKGNHYFLTVKTDGGEKVYVQTDDVWDKSDLVGVSIKPESIRIVKTEQK